jgi:hypothetical protein
MQVSSGVAKWATPRAVPRRLWPTCRTHGKRKKRVAALSSPHSLMFLLSHNSHASVPSHLPSCHCHTSVPLAPPPRLPLDLLFPRRHASGIHILHASPLSSRRHLLSRSPPSSGAVASRYICRHLFSIFLVQFLVYLLVEIVCTIASVFVSRFIGRNCQ